VGDEAKSLLDYANHGESDTWSQLPQQALISDLPQRFGPLRIGSKTTMPLLESIEQRFAGGRPLMLYSGGRNPVRPILAVEVDGGHGPIPFLGTRL